MALTEAFTMPLNGAFVSVIYNDANNRIMTVDWTLNVGHVARVQIWDNDIDPVVPVFDQTYGQGSGSQSIPGNYEMVQVTEFGETFMDLPPNLLYRINVETIG